MTATFWNEDHKRAVVARLWDWLNKHHQELRLSMDELDTLACFVLQEVEDSK